MKLSILANAHQEQEWLSRPQQLSAELIWSTDRKEFINIVADAYFDLLFDAESSLKSYSQLKSPVFINEVVRPFASFSVAQANFPFPLFRINVWPTFLKRDILEVSAFKKSDEPFAGKLLVDIGWKFKFVPDIPGLITPRVIAMVINEAYFTLEQNVSTKEEIDIAMKLGTNYPYGPFEWSERIGLRNILNLLDEMSRSDSKYQACSLLRKETGQQ